MKSSFWTKQSSVWTHHAHWWWRWKYPPHILNFSTRFTP